MESQFEQNMSRGPDQVNRKTLASIKQKNMEAIMGGAKDQQLFRMESYAEKRFKSKSSVGRSDSFGEDEDDNGHIEQVKNS